MSQTNQEKILARITGWFPDRHYGFCTDRDFCGENPARSFFMHSANVVSGSPDRYALVRFVPRLGSRGWAAFEIEVFKSQTEMHAADLAATATRKDAQGGAQ